MVPFPLYHFFLPPLLPFLRHFILLPPFYPPCHPCLPNSSLSLSVSLFINQPSLFLSTYQQTYLSLLLYTSLSLSLSLSLFLLLCFSSLRPSLLHHLLITISCIRERNALFCPHQSTKGRESKIKMCRGCDEMQRLE